MTKLFAVIGANFGDEGKGRTVDWLCMNHPNSIVVRHNSSAQAGHTVVLGDKRHVFSHFGSGTLRGTPTFLTHKFIVNPILFNQEWEELASLGIEPIVFMSSKCGMTTPLDRALNHIRELLRGPDRFGSVGVGFGTTIERQGWGLRLDVSHGRRDIIQMKHESHFMQETAHVQKAIQELDGGLRNIRDSIWDGTFNWKIFWDNYDLMMKRVRIIHNPSEFLRSRTKLYNLIFEGAQGLKLHETFGHGAPNHATWSRTGTEDIQELLFLNRLTSPLETYYVSRSYLTRHGAGPLPCEESVPSWLSDPTNIPNEWQGSLRYAPFNLEYIESGILLDLSNWCHNRKAGSAPLVQRTVLTCLDQLPTSEITREMTAFADHVFYSPEN